MTKSAAQLLMERETRVRHGPVDLTRFGYRLEPGRSHLEADSFLLHTLDGLSYSYRKGEGITICRSATADLSGEQLWLNGSVYSRQLPASTVSSRYTLPRWRMAARCLPSPRRAAVANRP